MGINNRNNMDVYNKSSVAYGGYEGEEFEDINDGLEINWTKVKELLSKEDYDSLLKTAIEQYMKYPSDSSNSLLKHEGIIATKRENTLDNLLGDDE